MTAITTSAPTCTIVVSIEQLRREALSEAAAWVESTPEALRWDVERVRREARADLTTYEGCPQDEAFRTAAVDEVLRLLDEAEEAAEAPTYEDELAYQALTRAQVGGW